MRLGIDLGGTKTEGVVLADDGRVVYRERRPTPARDGYEAILRTIVELTGDLETKAGVTCTVGIGTPGSLSAKTGFLKNSNTQALNGKPVREDLQQALQREVRIQNDANCFALAEAASGAGRGKHVVFGIIVGTGVGGGVVIGGAAHDGPNHIAGEWGHNVLEPDGPDCYCGKRGCVETLLSGPALERAYGQGVDAATVVARMQAGEREARAAIDTYVTRFGKALASVVNILDPDVVVLGGGLSAIERLTRETQSAMAPWLFNDVVATPIVKNELGDSAGVIGAAWLWPTTSARP
jgi:fructokinase